MTLSFVCEIRGVNGRQKTALENKSYLLLPANGSSLEDKQTSDVRLPAQKETTAAGWKLAVRGKVADLRATHTCKELTPGPDEPRGHRDSAIRERDLINYTHQGDNKPDAVIRPIWKDNRSR